MSTYIFIQHDLLIRIIKVLGKDHVNLCIYQTRTMNINHTESSKIIIVKHNLVKLLV